MIFGVCGFIGAGKNTVSRVFVQKYGFKSISFADSLKDCLSAVFGWDRNLLEGVTTESRIWREEIDTWWANKLNIPNFTPRFALTHIGTDIFRNTFNESIWLYSLEKRIENKSHNYIITDCRFKNELNILESYGGKLIRVDRNAPPHWVNYAKIANGTQKDTTIDSTSAKNYLRRIGVSPSEYEWIGANYDYVIENNLDYQHISNQVDNIIYMTAA